VRERFVCIGRLAPLPGHVRYQASVSRWLGSSSTTTSLGRAVDRRLPATVQAIRMVDVDSSSTTLRSPGR
jgi:hypothetical protein